MNARPDTAPLVEPTPVATALNILGGVALLGGIGLGLLLWSRSMPPVGTYGEQNPMLRDAAIAAFALGLVLGVLLIGVGSVLWRQSQLSVQLSDIAERL